MSDGSIEKLQWIESSWAPALDEFVKLFIDLDREPSDAQLEALSAIVGSSHNEVRAYISRKAADQGSDLLSKYRG